MGLKILKNIFTPLLGIAGLFFINSSTSPALFASIPTTKDLTEKTSKNPILNSSTKDFTKIIYVAKCYKLSKGKLHSECVPPQGIDGLVLNSTLSREGYDFYIMFTQYWNPPADAVNFQIVVKEYMRAGRNTALAISLNDKELVYRVVTPTYNALNNLASAAASHLSTYLKNGNHLNGAEVKSNLKDAKSDGRRITSPFDVY